MSDATFGKYRLIAELGHGGMADVFLAVVAGPAGSGFSKLTVVKRLRQNLADEPEFIEMLVDEARISARLNHPNVIQTNEVGSVGNQYFLAMEYLDGQPLHRIQHRAHNILAKAPKDEPPPDPFPRDCQYLVIADMLAGLHYAHELADYDGSPMGIVHRDITPHNVFVTYEGQVKVVDFGIAKAAGRSSETRQGVVKGKVRYMAPEQALGQSIDRRADLFAVGILLWEAATGKRLWQGVDEMEIVQRLLNGNIQASPREVRPDVPEEIDRICKKALERRPDDRYQTADDLRVDIEQFLAEQGVLVSARRKLGAAVSDLFKDKRSEIRTVIDRQLASLKEEDSRSLSSVPQLTDSSNSMLSMSGSTPIARVTLGATTTSAPDNTPAEPPPPGNRRLAIALVAITACTLVAAGVAAVGRSSERAAEARLPAAASASVAPVLRKIRVVLTAKPAGARILIDGAEVSAPYEAQVDADGSIHNVRIEAKGHDPRVETIRYDSDVSFNFALERSGKAGTPTGGAAAAPAAAAPNANANAAATAPPSTASAAVAPVEPTAHAATAIPSATTAPTAASSSKKIPKPMIDTSEDPWAKH